MDNSFAQSLDQTGLNPIDGDASQSADAPQKQQPAESASQHEGAPENPAAEAGEVLLHVGGHIPEEEEEGEYDDTDYTPDFINDLLQNPPIVAGDSVDAFGRLFESYEFNFMSPHRPKTDHEYMLVARATNISWELMRYDRMKALILQHYQHAAADRLHRRCNSSGSGQKSGSKTGSERPMRYFTDPAYRQQFIAKLEEAGLSPVVVDTEAYLRSLMPLSTIERLITSSENRLARILRQLEAAYLRRNPMQPMTQSNDASRLENKRK